MKLFTSMQATGIVVTYIDWSNIKELPFNIALFAFQLLFLVVGKILGKVEVEWREIWHAAQASHVRLCLRRISEPETSTCYEYINFGYPEAKLDYWRIDQCDGKRFEYRDPTFTLPQEAIAEMIDYAEGEIGKPYDKLQLLSPVINFVIWIFWWPLWGQEKIRWANQPGGAEFCSSGVTACLRWAAKYIHPDKLLFFFDYDTAMVMPCMFVISEKWRVK